MPMIGSALSIAPTNASAVNTAGAGQLYCGFASGLSAGFSTWANGTCQIPSANVTEGQTCELLARSRWNVGSALVEISADSVPADVVLTTGPSVDDASVLAGPAILLLGSNNATTAVRAARGSSNGTAGASGSAGGAAPSGSARPMSGASVMQVSGALSVLAGAVALLF